ncbi:MAG: hypothetical protein ACRD0P_18630 [Stackebrandtia sp.]
MTSPKLTKVSFMASPGLILLGWAVMRAMGTEGREPGWTIGHVLWLSGYLLVGVACVALYRMIVAARPTVRPVAGAVLVVAGVGTACLVVQMVIDLVAGFATSTVGDKNAFTDEIQAVPGILPLVYQWGPVLMFTALLAQTIHAAMARCVPAIAAVLVGASVLTMAGDRLVDTPIRLTMGVAAAVLWIAFAIVARGRTGSPAVATR